MSTNDDHPSIINCEKGYSVTHPGWAILRFRCKLHKIWTSHSKTFGLMDDCVTLIIRTALSLQIGVNVFRGLLKKDIIEHAVPMFGYPTAQVVAVRRARIDLYVGRKRPAAKLRGLTLDANDNGDLGRGPVPVLPQRGRI